jgi:hypothetical protein
VLARYKSASAFALLTFSLINLAALAVPANAAELFVFRSAHCPSCVAWEREIGRSYAATDEGRRAPLQHVDIDGGRGSSVADHHAVEVTPTFIVIERGREVGRIEGYSGGRKFWTQLRAIMARLPNA